MGMTGRGTGAGWGVAIAVLVCAAVAAPAAGATPLRFGLNNGIPVHDDRLHGALELQQTLGATVHRANIPWRNVQPRPGVWNWAYVDKLVGLAEARGLNTIALISSTPPWASTTAWLPECADPWAARCQRPPAPDRLEALQAFVVGLAQRYPSLVAIEVFNEPNLANWNWQPHADPAYYTRVLRAVHDAVKHVRPELPVISGGLSPLPAPAPAGAMPPDQFLEEMYRAGARDAMDGLGIHPYPGKASADNPAGSYRRLLSSFRASRDRHGHRGASLWVTETGYTTTGPFAVTPAEQARLLPELVADALRQRDIAAVIVHTLIDKAHGQEHPESGYGLVHGDLSSKPVFSRLRGAVAEEQARRRAESSRRARRKTARKRCARKGRASSRRTCRCRRTRDSAAKRRKRRATRCAPSRRKRGGTSKVRS